MTNSNKIKELPLLSALFNLHSSLTSRMAVAVCSNPSAFPSASVFFKIAHWNLQMINTFKNQKNLCTSAAAGNMFLCIDELRV
jgi:hypothetical protein